MSIATWLIDLDADGAADAGPAAWLDDDERERAARFLRADDRRRYIAAHVALRRLLGVACMVPPAQLEVRREPCLACGERHGRPFVDGGPHFSLSRSGRWAAVAIDDEAMVGIDIEVVCDPASIEPLRSDLVADDEAADADDLLRLWVRKEAYLKATGAGLTRSMNTVRAQDLDAVVDLELAVGLVGAVARFTGASPASAKVPPPTTTRLAR